MFLNFFILLMISKCFHAAVNCRGRNYELRHDGGLCFEIPPWQYQPVEIEEHLNKLKDTLGYSTDRRQFRNPTLSLVNSEINRYMSTVIAPFLDTYHRNIQNSYHRWTSVILKTIQKEIKDALIMKQTIYKELTDLANKLNVSAMCDEERRAARTLASKHVALTFKCTEEARSSIAKIGKYAEEMIRITKNHMQEVVADAAKKIDINVSKSNIKTSLSEISRAATSLGYELDLSLTNARVYNEQSCEKLANCCGTVRHNTDEEVKAHSEYLYQCMFA